MRPRKVYEPSVLENDAWGRQWIVYSFWLEDAMPEDLQRYRRRMAFGTIAEVAFDLGLLYDLHAASPILVRERAETTAWMNRTTVQYRVAVVEGKRVPETKGLAYFDPTPENLAYLDDGHWRVFTVEEYAELMSR